MIIRHTEPNDLAEVMELYASAVSFMTENNNPTQWGLGYPPVEYILKDIELKKSYVCEADGRLLAVFYMAKEHDATYDYIEGEWPSDEPYAVVHRIAAPTNVKGVGEFCLRYVMGLHNHIRIDTHEANAPMLNLLKKLGFVRCGKIYVRNHEERIAFCWIQ